MLLGCFRFGGGARVLVLPVWWLGSFKYSGWAESATVSGGGLVVVGDSGGAVGLGLCFPVSW